MGTFVSPRDARSSWRVSDPSLPPDRLGSRRRSWEQPSICEKPGTPGSAGAIQKAASASQMDERQRVPAGAAVADRSRDQTHDEDRRREAQHRTGYHADGSQNASGPSVDQAPGRTLADRDADPIAEDDNGAGACPLPERQWREKGTADVPDHLQSAAAADAAGRRKTTRAAGADQFCRCVIEIALRQRGNMGEIGDCSGTMGAI